MRHLAGANTERGELVATGTGDAIGDAGVESRLDDADAKARAAAARTRDTLWNTIGRLLDAFSPTECRNYLINSGYACD